VVVEVSLSVVSMNSEAFLSHMVMSWLVEQFGFLKFLVLVSAGLSALLQDVLVICPWVCSCL